jgi:hypothetical protein
MKKEEKPKRLLAEEVPKTKTTGHPLEPDHPLYDEKKIKEMQERGEWPD